jgi:protein-tyrosine phosphatase
MRQRHLPPASLPALGTFVDLHSHLAPAVDDGCSTLEETFESLYRLRSEHVREVVLTPHFGFPMRFSDEEIRARLGRIRDATAGVIQHRCGCPTAPEVRRGLEFLASSPAHVSRMVAWPELRIDGTNHVLLEFGFGKLQDTDAIVERALDAGVRVLIAHPERYAFDGVADGLRLIRRWREIGAHLQTNLGCLAGDYSASTPRAEAIAWEMIRKGLTHVLSSDDHGSARPQSHHRRVAEMLRACGGEEQATLLLSGNAEQILNGRDPISVPALRTAPRRADAGGTVSTARTSNSA